MQPGDYSRSFTKSYGNSLRRCWREKIQDKPCKQLLSSMKRIFA